MKKIQSWRIALFALVLALAFVVLPDPTPAITMGQPIFDQSVNSFISEISFGEGGYAVIYFRNTDQATEFANLAGVEVVMRALPVKIVPSDIVVAASWIKTEEAGP